jgi:hypothetical protein
MADVYYPNCWVRLRLRFEDFVQLPQPPTSPAIPNTDPVDYGFVVIDQRIIPTHCSVTLNSYRKADEATITIPFGRLPIDPRWLRAAAVQIYMGTLDPAEHSDGIGPIYGESRLTLIGETTNPGIEDIISGAAEVVSNEIFRGLVDDWEVNQDGDDTVEISCRDLTAVLIDSEMPTQGLAGIPKTMPIDEVIRQIVIGDPAAQGVPPDRREERPRRLDARRDVRRLQVRLEYITTRITRVTAAIATDPTNIGLQNELTRLATKQASILAALSTSGSVAAAADAVPILAQRYGHPAFRGLSVVNETGELVLPTIGQVKGPTYFDSKGTAKKARSGGKGRISYWDFITDICVGAGYICYMRTPTLASSGGQLPQSELVISLPKTYYPDSPDVLRSFFFGVNVDSLSVKRNFQGRNIPTGVAVSAIEARTGQTISSRFPTEEQVNRPAANQAGVGDRTEYTTITLQDRIPGLDAQKTLDRIAESVYEQLSRGEFMVNIQTTTLNSILSTPGGRELGQGITASGLKEGQTDMLQLRAGDPILIGIVPSSPDPVSPTVTQAGNFGALGLLEKGRVLKDVFGFSDEAAALAAVASESDSVQSVFYTREVGIDFDQGSGFKFSIEAINYLDARNAVNKILEGRQATLDLIEKYARIDASEG